jgi:hypothetical protein
MEAAEPAPEPSKELSMLERIRNMWEFAALAQYIFTFGRAVKIDENLDTEVYNPTDRLLRPPTCDTKNHYLGP